MSKKKIDDRIIVTLCGGQSESVTGSITSVSYLKDDGTRGLILLELGGIQGNNDIKGEYLENKHMLENAPLKGVEYVFVMHNHQDHCMHLPYLVSSGESTRIIITHKNKELLKPMLLDSTYIHGKNIEYLKSKGFKSAKPFYTEQDTHATFDLMDEFNMDTIYKLNNNISFRFVGNSHVIGATQLELFIKKPNGSVKKILYTSDLGNNFSSEFQPFLIDNKKITKANLMLIESTYGDRKPFTRKECIEEREELFRTIDKYVIQDRKSCLIPCFAFGRLENIMCMLYDRYKDTWNPENPIIIDTTLGYEEIKKYSQVLEGEELEYWNEVVNWKCLKYITDYKSSMAFQSQKDRHGLILSSSGMISAGRSVLHAYNILQDSKSVICFCGYCSPNTIGGKILDENYKTVDFPDHKGVSKRCEIKRFYTFSSHAQQDTLLDYIKQMPNSCKIVLHHGDNNAKQELLMKAKEELSKINKTTKIEKSYKDMQIVL